MPRPDPLHGIERHVRSASPALAATLAVVGVVAVVSAIFTPEGFREIAVRVALGLTVLITTFLTRDQLRSTRRSRAATQLSEAANLLATDKPISRQAGVYLLSSLRTDRDVDRDSRDSAEELLDAALRQVGDVRTSGSDIDKIIVGELAIETPEEVMAATPVRRWYARRRRPSDGAARPRST